MTTPPGEPDASKQDPVESHGESPPGVPRWVKVVALVAGILVLVFVFLLLTGIGGQHGPGRHISAGTVTPADAPASLALGDA
jgi:hypothetical protein